MLITNIGELITNAPLDAVSVASPGPFAAIENAAIVLDDGLVAWTGPASAAPEADEVVDAGGRAVLPGFVDSHAHLVFAGERGAEFAARMAGLPYSAGRDRQLGRGNQGSQRRAAAGEPGPAGGRDAGAGDDDVRVQVRVRADRG